MPRTSSSKNGGGEVPVTPSAPPATAAGITQAPAPSRATGTSAPPTQPQPPQPEDRLEQPAADEREDTAASREERIRRAAYDAYVRRGDGPGDAQQDWLQAEAQIDGRSS
uniref:DUF2934 domain-containing protein n=1 Tax=Variovorax sp. BK018 TaxID=3450241 RepID=UPI0040397BD7